MLDPRAHALPEELDLGLELADEGALERGEEGDGGRGGAQGEVGDGHGRGVFERGVVRVDLAEVHREGLDGTQGGLDPCQGADGFGPLVGLVVAHEEGVEAGAVSSVSFPLFWGSQGWVHTA